MTTLKQLAIAASPDGVIGYEGKLLFRSSRDMRNFSDFTQNTVMIAGRNTAEEMLGMGCPVHAKRPLIVVSTHVLGVDLSKGRTSDIFYAKDLSLAIQLAAVIAKEQDLAGWTIVGGAQVYNQVFQDGLKLDRLYVAQFEAIDPSLDDSLKAKLSVSLRDFVARLEGAMVTPVARRVVGAVPLQQESAASQVVFRHTCDTEFFDPVAVSLNIHTLRIDYDLGQLRLDIRMITTYCRLRDRPVVTITLHDGAQHTVRLETEAQVNYLMYLLDTFSAL